MTDCQVSDTDHCPRCGTEDILYLPDVGYWIVSDRVWVAPDNWRCRRSRKVDACPKCGIALPCGERASRKELRRLYPW